MTHDKSSPRASTRAKPPLRVPNEEKRSREFITPTELEKLTAAAESVGRHGLRDALIISMAYIHALRAGELIRLTWDDIDLEAKTISIERIKGGVPSKHGLSLFEVSQLQELRADAPRSKHVFCSERHGPLTSRAVHSIVARAGTIAGLELSIHPQMLCAGRGYQLISEGWEIKAVQDYLGHKSARIVESYARKSGHYLKYVKRHPVFLDKSIPVVNFASASEALSPDLLTEGSITVEIPAGTCNLGPGLDSFGLALSLYTRLTIGFGEVNISDSPLVNVKGRMAKRSQVAEHSELVYTLLSKLWRFDANALKKMKIDIVSDIPLGCGLGASGSVVLGAVWASHVFQGKLPSCRTILKECRTLEAHPETTAASLLGGMTIFGDTPGDESSLVRHIDWPDDWTILLVLPSYSLKTAESRKVLPRTYPRADVIHNIQRASLLVSAVYEKDEELLKHTFSDRLHESYREAVVPELSKVRNLLEGEDHLGVFLAGGGSSVAVVVNSRQKDRINELLQDWALVEDNQIDILDLYVPAQGMRELVKV